MVFAAETFSLISHLENSISMETMTQTSSACFPKLLQQFTFIQNVNVIQEQQRFLDIFWFWLQWFIVIVFNNQLLIIIIMKVFSYELNFLHKSIKVGICSIIRIGVGLVGLLRVGASDADKCSLTNVTEYFLFVMLAHLITIILQLLQFNGSIISTRNVHWYGCIISWKY